MTADEQTRRAINTLSASLYGSAVSPDEQQAAERAIAALKRAKLLAPAPLREVRSRGTLSGGVLHFFGDEPAEYVKYQTAWLPVDHDDRHGKAKSQ